MTYAMSLQTEWHLFKLSAWQPSCLLSRSYWINGCLISFQSFSAPLKESSGNAGHRIVKEWNIKWWYTQCHFNLSDIYLSHTRSLFGHFYVILTSLWRQKCDVIKTYKYNHTTFLSVRPHLIQVKMIFNYQLKVMHRT